MPATAEAQRPSACGGCKGEWGKSITVNPGQAVSFAPLQTEVPPMAGR